MAFVGKEANDKKIIKKIDNIAKEDEVVLNSLNLSSNNEKGNINNILPKENENKIIQTKESEESIGIESKNKYIKKYKSQNSRLYGISFQSSIESNLINVAVSSLNMNKNNNISLLSFSQEDIFNDEDNINYIYSLNNINSINSINNKSIYLKSQIEMELPVSSILFSPHEQNKNLLMSASDILRLYSFDGENLSLKYEFKKRIKNYCGPISACDWSLANNSIVGVSSIDTTCSILDLNKLHTGADGSVRLFDSRSANTSSIIFETIDKSPLTRLKWNKYNPNFILTVILDKNEIYILDQRKLSSPYAILKVHTNVVNNAIWAPQSCTNLISVSDDKSALLWDIYCDSDQPEEYIMKYNAESEIENVAWGDVTQNWVGIIDGNQAEILRIQ